ncbi:hypothetical protein IHI24_000411 [Rickettsia endosymbiont of Cardiosporidium cionae]|nr:hypothetical protein IHI24_000411 [Rickettsia endosymbiont of Cardiosporidium cionae]
MQFILSLYSIQVFKFTSLLQNFILLLYLTIAIIDVFKLSDFLISELFTLF